MVTRLTFQKHPTTKMFWKCFRTGFVSGAVLRQLWSLILNPYRVNGKASWVGQEWMWTDRLWHKTARLLIRARLHRHLHSPLRQSIQSKRGYEKLSESLPWNHSQSEWPQFCTLHTSWQFLTVTQDVITSPPSFSLSLLFLGAVRCFCHNATWACFLYSHYTIQRAEGDCVCPIRGIIRRGLLGTLSGALWWRGTTKVLHGIYSPDPEEKGVGLSSMGRNLMCGSALSQLILLIQCKYKFRA